MRDKMREDDVSYCRRRALEEQLAARKATCEVARERHDELATMYQFRATMLSTEPAAWGGALQPELSFQAA